MKKIITLAIIALTIASNAMALELNEYKVFYKLNNATTFRSLDRYLKLNDIQKENLKSEFSATGEKIKAAVNTEDGVAAEEAMNTGLNNLKSILTVEQYEKFVLALNATIEYNREIKYLAAE
ncbi:MAG: hypothetical protein PHH37_14655 [Paludibacter sp.]|nr:hypothetical protein [Paludibacter sp.]